MIKKLLTILIIIITSVFLYSRDAGFGNNIFVGAANLEDYLHFIENKKVGIVANQSSMVDKAHLVDTLLTLGINIGAIFSPEHGFRGKVDRGELISDSIDEKTGIPILSVYGKNKKPSAEQLKGIDIMLFDLQDVGVRFYTYLSTLHYVMEACAENNIPLIILDRPNPNGFYIDGPVLETAHKSFVGIYPIPIVHGMTLGELAQMAVGEKWVCQGVKLDLKVILCRNYTHDSLYQLPEKPSPNLPNMQAVYLYPSLCLLEGTPVSMGRGTDFPFQMYGHPEMKIYDTVFIPRSIDSASMNPLLKGEKCYGKNLRNLSHDEIRVFSLEYLFDAFDQLKEREDFFTSYFTLLIGNTWLQNDIAEGKTIEEIRSKWQTDLEIFKQNRKKYLLYPDFTH